MDANGQCDIRSWVADVLDEPDEQGATPEDRGQVIDEDETAATLAAATVASIPSTRELAPLGDTQASVGGALARITPERQEEFVDRTRDSRRGPVERLGPEETDGKQEHVQGVLALWTRNLYK